jgi:hypothetical protein
MKMKIRLLVLAMAICMIAAPAKADLFGFHLGNLSLNYDGAATVTTTGAGSTSGSLYRNIAPAGTAQFLASSWGTGSEALTISMALSNLTGSTADATGTMSFVDVDGTTIAANLAGTWNNAAGLPIFQGKLTTVTSLPTGANFDGHTGSVDMNYSAPQPWRGAIVQLTATSNWFTSGTQLASRGGSIDVSVVPVPAAVVLGVLGLGVAGLKLRKFA